MPGRGAWTAIGKDNGLRQYTYLPGTTLDGANRTKSTAHFAVNLGVKAIQTQINKQRLAVTPLIVDGILGAKTMQAIKEAQAKLGVGIDGKAGAVFCKALWRNEIRLASTAAGIDPKYLYGKMSHESSGDPGACGYYNEPDRGLCQINTAVHTDVSLEEAHDPHFNLNYTANRFKSALDKYKAKPNLQVVCAIAQHNSPVSADAWFRNGYAPNQKIKDYVDAVLEYTSEW